MLITVDALAEAGHNAVSPFRKFADGSSKAIGQNWSNAEHVEKAMPEDESTPEQLADDAAAKALLRRARAVVQEVTGSTPDAQVAEVMRYLVLARIDREPPPGDAHIACLARTPEEMH